jgi:hypothetical protein
MEIVLVLILHNEKKGNGWMDKIKYPIIRVFLNNIGQCQSELNISLVDKIYMSLKILKFSYLYIGMILLRFYSARFAIGNL